MRMILLTVLALVVGYGVLQLDSIDPDNYVKIYFANHSYEMKLLGFLLLLFITVLVIYVLIRVLHLVWRSPSSWSNWRQRRNRDKAELKFGAGYLSLIKGDWKKAESQLTAKPSHSHVSYVNYLAAAEAAQQQGRFQQRDEYLQAAYAAAPKERLAIGLTKAKLHQMAGQLEQTQATLNDIRPLASSNAQFTAMLLQTQQQTEDWAAAKNLLPLARKQHALPTEVLQSLEVELHHKGLVDAVDKELAWAELPRAQKKNVANITVYVSDLLLKGETTKAEKIIRSTLKHSWSDELVDLYGRLQSEKPEKLLRRVEGWLMARPENAHLNLAAGRLAKAAKSYDVAKQYLQTAISQAALPAAYVVLGEVFEANSESGKALQTYRIGLQATASQPLLEMPADSGGIVSVGKNKHTDIISPVNAAVPSIKDT